MNAPLSRREFLKASGALIVTAAGPAFIGEALAQTAAGAKPPLVPTELDSWVAITPDGRVTAFFGKMDMGQSLDIAIQANPKSPSEYRIVGKSLTRRDLPGKVYRTEKYVTDISLPKMLHARVIRCARAACTVAGIDESSIKRVKGARVVREKDFVAVVADHEWDAVRASRMLKIRSEEHTSELQSQSNLVCR